MRTISFFLSSPAATINHEISDMTNYHPQNMKQNLMSGTSTIKVLINVPVVSTDKSKMHFLSP